MKKIKGFTLIELIIAISILTLIVTGASQLISLSLQSYEVTSNINDAINVSNLFLNRLEAKLTESVVKNDEIYYPYIKSADFSNNNGFTIGYRSKDGIELSSDNDIIYNYDTAGTKNITENGKIILNSSLSVDANGYARNIYVSSCKFIFYATNGDYETIKEIVSAEEIDFIRVELNINSRGDDPVYNLSTGISIR